MSCLPCSKAGRRSSLVVPSGPPNPLRVVSFREAFTGSTTEAAAAAVAAAEAAAVPEDEALTVKVVVRVRPLIEREKGGKEVLEVAGPGAVRLPDKEGGSGYSFAFDSVLGAGATQADTYAQVAPVLEKALQGFNATVFAYGQTGSGKTYAMEGSAGTARDASAAAGGDGGGIIPRLAEALFGAPASGRRRGASRLEGLTLTAEYVEIYNERIIDLLDGGAAASRGGGGGEEEDEASGSSSGGSLSIRQRADGEIYLEGAAQRACASARALLALLAEGSARRSRGETHMNAASSRSHAVLTLHLTLHWSGLPPRTSKLHLIDLAGSERADATGARGERLKEGAQINKSLSALGGVIAALTTPGRAHIPYRDSKLTRLLQDSLGGNAVTLMLCCVSPAAGSADETLSSLRFAERAKKVRNVAKVNVDAGAARLAALEGALRAAEERGRLLEAALGQRLGAAWPADAAAAAAPAHRAAVEAGRALVEGEVARALREVEAAPRGSMLAALGGGAGAGAGGGGEEGASLRPAAEGGPGKGALAAGGGAVKGSGCLPCCTQ